MQCNLRLLILMIENFALIKGTIYRNNSGLVTDIPEDVPPDTTFLDLGNNKIVVVNSTRLRYLTSLEALRLGSNRLMAFPDVCVVGATLKRFFLDQNWGIKSIPEALVECLVVLEHFEMWANDLDAFPNLSSIGETLLVLYVGIGKIASVPDENFANMTKLRVLYLDNSKLRTVPDFGAAKNTLTRLHINDNLITTFRKSVFNESTPLMVLDCSNNLLTSFPNLCVLHNGPAIDIDLSNNPLQYIKRNNTSCLKKVKRLVMKDISISDTQNISLYQSHETLEELVISSRILPEILYLGPLRNVFLLDISYNTILQDIAASFFVGFDSMTELHIGNSGLKKFPDLNAVNSSLQIISAQETNFSTISFRNMAILSNVKRINFQQSHMSVLPTMCPKDPAKFEIDIYNSNIDLCICHNLWLKVAHEKSASVITSPGAQCNSLFLENATLADLVNTCKKYEGKPMRQCYLKAALFDFICRLPLSKYYSDVTLWHCARNCIETPGCYSVNYKRMNNDQYNKRKGDCMLIAPDSDGFQIPGNFSDTGWILYEFVCDDFQLGN